MIAVTFANVVILVPLAVVTIFFALEVFVGLRPLQSMTSSLGRFSAVIIIPAHNEQGVVGGTVSQIRAEADGVFPILVVADNCTDGTADVARAAGASVVIRHEPDRRGKGFALTAACEHLRSNPPDVVIVVDADCRIDKRSLHVLTASAARSARPCQAVNLLTPDLNASGMVQLSTFAFMLKNLVRQRGLQRLAGRAHLTGTGMALPWQVFATANLGGSSIVEDLALSLDLAGRSTPPMLVEGATVWSPAASSDGTLVQRQRWEGGYLAVALKTAPAALMRSLRRVDLRELCAALDICVLPLALLMLLNAGGFVIASVSVLIGGAVWPLIVYLAIGVLVALAVGLAWFWEGRRFVSGATLLRFPLYVLWKLPLYLGLLRRGAPKDWRRVGR